MKITHDVNELLSISIKIARDVNNPRMKNLLRTKKKKKKKLN
jgi:hypothetical protein